MVLTTSNITEAIDLAFVDRADIKAYIGPPGLRARYEILRSAVNELHRTGLIGKGDLLDLPVPIEKVSAGVLFLIKDDDACEPAAAAATGELDDVALASKGLSGRALRKLPFLAFDTARRMASKEGREKPNVCEFLQAMKHAANTEFKDRELLRKDNL